MSAIDDLNLVNEEKWIQDMTAVTVPTESQIIANVYDPESNSLKVVSV